MRGRATKDDEDKNTEKAYTRVNKESEDENTLWNGSHK